MHELLHQSRDRPIGKVWNKRLISQFWTLIMRMWINFQNWLKRNVLQNTSKTWLEKYLRKRCDVIRPENTKEVWTKFSTRKLSERTFNKYKWALNKWYPYISNSEISTKILTDDVINATVNPTNTPMAWDFTNIFLSLSLAVKLFWNTVTWQCYWIGRGRKKVWFKWLLLSIEPTVELHDGIRDSP